MIEACKAAQAEEKPNIALIAREYGVLSTGGGSSLLINVQHLARLYNCLMLYIVCIAGISPSHREPSFLKPSKRYKLPIQIVLRRSRPSIQTFVTDIDYITTSIIHTLLVGHYKTGLGRAASLVRLGNQLIERLRGIRRKP
jgi:hypothetical protein